MRWFRIPKHSATPPRRGTYRSWKKQLAVEGQHQCVYCALPEGRFGGSYNFHVEHFEPKSRAPARTNEWANLFYSCAICNVFKGDDWPDPNGPCAYINPAQIDFETTFERRDHGDLRGRNPNARYMVERLYLNRPQLLLERREFELRQRLQKVNDAIQAALESEFRQSPQVLQLVVRLAATQARVQGLLQALWTVQPYSPEEVRRPRTNVRR